MAYPDRLYGRVLAGWDEGFYDIVWSQETLAEYESVLLDGEYLKEFDHLEEVQLFLALVFLCGIEADTSNVQIPRIRDLHDQIWLRAALGGEADYLVTVDQDFMEPDLVRAMREKGVTVTRPDLFWREITKP